MVERGNHDPSDRGDLALSLEDIRRSWQRNIELTRASLELFWKHRLTISIVGLAGATAVLFMPHSPSENDSCQVLLTPPVQSSPYSPLLLYFSFNDEKGHPVRQFVIDREVDALPQASYPPTLTVYRCSPSGLENKIDQIRQSLIAQGLHPQIANSPADLKP